MFLKVQTIDTKRSIKTNHEINQPLPATANWSARFRSRLLKDKTCWKNICSSWVILHFSTILSKSKFNPQTSQFTEQFLSSSSCFFVQLNHEPAKPNMKKKLMITMTTTFITQILTGYENIISFLLPANTNNSLDRKLRSHFCQQAKNYIQYCQNLWNADMVL